VADFPGMMWRRTKEAPTYDWALTDFNHDIGGLSRSAMSAIGRWSKAIDDDAHLLAMAGIEFDRMELRRYQAEPLRMSLCVDGRIVREYTLTVKVDEG
jgi:hypothetical protein